MQILTYKKVFSKYERKFTHNVARKTYYIYKKIRIGIEKWFPLKAFEKYHFEEHYLRSSKCSKFPTGYDEKLKKEVDGVIELKYIDFFDYLPKEDIEDFKKRLRKFALKNKHTLFSSFRTTEDDDRITDMGRYSDGEAFANLHTVEIGDDLFHKMFAPQVTISIHNLSASFLVLKYRFYISDEFNEKLITAYRAEYESSSDVSRQYDTPWYKPWRFGKAYFTGDNERTKAVYSLMAELKWNAYKLVKKYFRVYFGNDNMFPPTFETYHTNIRASDNRDSRSFWESIGLEYDTDYSIEYNACVSWCRNTEKNEGIVLRAFCGGNYQKGDYLPEIAEYEISNIYLVYMVASTIRQIAERDIAKWNIRISNAIRRKKPFRLLAVRSQVDQKLYYCYRFMSEFSGETLETDDTTRFRNPLYKDTSKTKVCFDSMPSWISETKNQVDILLNLLKNATEIQASKSNMWMQRQMVIITILSLIITVITLTNFKIDVPEVLKTIHDYCVQGMQE